MGKKIRLKELRRHNAQQAFTAQLAAHSRTNIGSPVVGSYAELGAARRAEIEMFAARRLRDPDDWRCRIKSRCADRRFLELVKFTFAKYPVAPHLERVWLDPHYDHVNREAAAVRHVGERRGTDLRGWYIVAAQGGSVHKQLTQGFFSKAETHHFLTAPPEVTETRRAFWYAVARAQCGDRHRAVLVSRSKLVDYSITSTFWQEVARVFARNAVPLAEMNDLVDYLLTAKLEDEAYSLKGRTLQTLRRRMAAWHRSLRKRAQVCGGAWEGHPLPDITYEAGSEHKRALWHFRQIKTGNDLYREGERMHHCVVSYKWRCESGDISIWSLVSEFPIGKRNRGVTMEVRNDGRIVQCRGFANRLPYANEVAMVKRWAADHGLTWCAIEG